MVSPTVALDLAKATADAYARAERQLLRDIARRIERGGDIADWQSRKLAEVVEVRRAAEQVMADIDAGGLAGDAAGKAFDRGVASADAELRRRVSASAAAGQANTAPVLTMAARLQGRLEATHLPIVRRVADIYRDVIADTSRLVLAGTHTRRQATASALATMRRNGVSGFVDRAGRHWNMRSYAAMATRTTTAQAAVVGHQQKLQANGFDLVVVTDSPEECPLCRPWENRVLSLSGGDRRYSSFSEATQAGLFHPNCTHATSLYIPGATRDAIEERGPEPGEPTPPTDQEPGPGQAEPADQPGGLTRSQAQAAEAWQDDYENTINRRLRSGDTSDPVVQQLDAAIAAQDPLAGRGECHRAFAGMTPESHPEVFRHGGTFRDDGFVATTKSRDVASTYAFDTGGTVVDVRIPKGERVLDLENALRDTGQREVLVPRGREYSMLKIGGRWIATMQP